MNLSKKYHPEVLQEFINQEDARKLVKDVIKQDSPSSPLLFYGLMV